MSSTQTPRLALTEALVRRATRPVDGPRLNEAWHLLDDAEIDQLAEKLTRDYPRPIPVFAYGSLIWRPDFAVGARRRATALGWHRQFNIPLDHFRGSPEHPGLMLSLAAGGNCEGLILEIEAGTERESMRSLIARELGARELAANARWIEVMTDQGRSKALTFYAGPVDIALTTLTLPEQAQLLARANGVAGSGAEYLQRTAQGLAEAGIRDPYIWQLQELVAAEIESWPIEDSPSGIEP